MLNLQVLLYSCLLSLSLLTPQDNETRIITGQLLEDNEPIIGEYIYEVNNPDNQTLSNLEGEFQLKIPKGTNVKIGVQMFICSDYPEKILVKKDEAEVILMLEDCEFKKLKNR